MRTPVMVTWAGLVLAAVLLPVVRADDIADIISQATVAEYQSYERVLTGVDPIPGNPPHYLTNRYSQGQDIQIAGQWIRDEFTSFGVNAFFHTFGTGYGPNVIAELPGTTRPQDIYIICGHYDTYHDGDQLHAPGCDDNGSGTAAAMMAARILSQYEFEGTLRFIAFSAEEQWMVGSNAYVQERRNAGDNIVAAINVDMVLHPSWDAQPPGPIGLHIEKNAASTALADYMVSRFAQYTPLTTIVGIDSYGAGDHAAFWNYGYQSIDLIEHTAPEIWWQGANAEYHQLTDTFANPHLDWPFGLETVRGGMAALIGLAGLVIPPATCAGDPNCDGRIDFADIDYFVEALGGFAAWQPKYPDCPWLNADTNGDGTVDFDDIDPFVALLSNGATCP